MAKEFQVEINLDHATGRVYGIEISLYEGNDLDRSWYDTIRGWKISDLDIYISDEKVKEKERKAEALLNNGASYEDVVMDILEIVAFPA